MLETSKDLLNILIAVSVVAFTFFICWAIYYIVMMLKRAHIAIKEVTDFIASLKEKLNRLESLLKTIEEKIKNSASYLPIILKGSSDIIDYFKKKKEAKKAKKKNL